MCTAFTAPKVGEKYIKTAGTATADNVLESCTVCASDKFSSTACTATADTACAARTAAVDGQTFVKKAGNATLDNEIGTCKTCGDGEWMNTTCTVTHDAKCSPFAQPEKGKYIKTAGSASADNVIEECSTCQADVKFVETNCTTNTDTVCKACKTCSAAEYMKAACSANTDTECVTAPTFSMLTVKTGKSCTMANSSAITSADYTSDSEWKFAFKADGGGDALASQGAVVAPCANDQCDKKDGVMDAAQNIVAGALTVPKTVVITAAPGSPDGWCVASICISSGAKAYKWTGSQWMNPGSTGPDAGAATSWTKNLVEAASCDDSTSASTDGGDSNGASSELADTAENDETSANGIHVAAASQELNSIQTQIDNVGDAI
jgi:hypothetical protein